MSDRWATKSDAPIESAPVLKQIGQLLIDSVSGFFNGWASDWEQDLFDCLNRELPVACAYYFVKNNVRRYYVIIQNPTSENILKVLEACCNFEERLMEKDNTFFCEFLVFGTKEEAFLGIPETARKITQHSEEDYAGNTRTLNTVQA